MNKGKLILSALAAVMLIAADQVVKYLIRVNGGFYICNKDLAFGINLPDFFFYILWLTIVLLIIYLFAKRNLKLVNYNSDKNSFRITNYQLLITVLIFCGAISNITDRLMLAALQISSTLNSGRYLTWRTFISRRVL